MRFPRLRLACLAAVLTLAGVGVQADKADRYQPLTIEADKPGTLDMQRRVVVFNGNVVMAQGTMRIRAERVELREVGEGHRTAVALGDGGQRAQFRQKREGLDEFIEGEAERIEYDSRSELLRLVGRAEVRRLRGSAVADQITGKLITYDSAAELFSVQGDQAAGGRVRAVITPPPPAASAPPPAGASGR